MKNNIDLVEKYLKREKATLIIWYQNETWNAAIDGHEVSETITLSQPSIKALLNAIAQYEKSLARAIQLYAQLLKDI